MLRRRRRRRPRRRRRQRLRSGESYGNFAAMRVGISTKGVLTYPPVPTPRTNHMLLGRAQRHRWWREVSWHDHVDGQDSVHLIWEEALLFDVAKLGGEATRRL